MFEKDNVVMFLRVVQGCNLNCAHCFTLGNQDKTLTTPFEYIDKFITSIKDNVDPRRGVVYLHGGETFLAKLSYLRKVTKRVRELFSKEDFKIIPQTNLVYKLTDDFISFIRNECNGHIGVSWDAKIRFGSIKSEHQVRQEELYFNNIKILLENNFKVHITITVQKHLLDVDVSKIIKMFDGVASIDFEHLTMFDDKTRDLRVNLSKWSNWFDKLVDYYQNNNVSWCLPQVDLFTKSIEDGEIYSCKCNCCDRRTFTLNPNGTTGFCPDNSYIAPVSNVDEMKDNWSLYEHKAHDAHIERLATLNTENCYTCEHYSECGGNCEDSFFDDSGECPLSKKVISRIKENRTIFIKLLNERTSNNLAELQQKKDF